MTIDADLILRQARELQLRRLEDARAKELAVEVQGLLDTALGASRQAQFDDEPERFLYVLSALRDAPLT